MPLDTYLSFLIVSCLIIIVPGPNVTLTVATSTTQGIRAGLITVLGTTLAQLMQIIFVALGLVWLVATYGSIFEIMRYLGAVYLIYLGIQTWRSARDPLPQPSCHLHIARRGLLVGLANPKSLTFFAAFFPQFINPNLAPEPQFALLAASYVVLALVLDAGYAIAGGMGYRLFATEKARLWLGRSSGLVLIGGGAFLAGVRKD